MKNEVEQLREENSALREQLEEAKHERDRARTQLTEAEKVLKAYGWTRR